MKETCIFKWGRKERQRSWHGLVPCPCKNIDSNNQIQNVFFLLLLGRSIHALWAHEGHKGQLTVWTHDKKRKSCSNVTHLLMWCEATYLTSDDLSLLLKHVFVLHQTNKSWTIWNVMKNRQVFYCLYSLGSQWTNSSWIKTFI